MINQMSRSIEPNLLNLFRYFCGVAATYFAILWVYAILSTGWLWQAQLQFWGSFTFYLLLLAYLSWPWLERHMKRFYLPFGLALATLYPVASSSFGLFASGGDLFALIYRSWLWLPVLFVPLVLIAWQYNFASVLTFTIFTNLSELIVLLLVADEITFQTMPLLGVPFIRAFAFGMVGHIVTNSMDTQRSQRRKLIQANARLGQYANTLEQLATSRERNRLASELHDTLAHTLSGLVVNLEAIKTVVAPTDTEAQDMLDRALLTSRNGLDETRRALKALRAGPLEDLGLRLALKALIESAAGRANIPVEFDYPQPAPSLPVDVEQNLYRIVQEALENVVRHANASRATVRLESVNGGVKLSVNDDGSGFDPAERGSENRFGLRGLRERAEASGGRLDVASRPGQGTEITFFWEPEHD
ncbi:sensor histidine kinase [bacterium]|nr:MAG: sensor histidine kinase [bacterium]